jgi:hypothetical protein
MACVIFHCLNCDNYDSSGFGGFSNPVCPKCESSHISVEYDEDRSESFRDDDYDIDEYYEEEDEYGYY